MPHDKNKGYAHLLSGLMGGHNDMRAQNGDLPFMALIGLGHMAFGVGNYKKESQQRIGNKMRLDQLGKTITHHRRPLDVTVVHNYVNSGEATIDGDGEIMKVPFGLDVNRTLHYAFPLSSPFETYYEKSTGKQMQEYSESMSNAASAITIMVSFANATQMAKTLVNLARWSAEVVRPDTSFYMDSTFLSFDLKQIAELRTYTVDGTTYTHEDSSLGGSNSLNKLVPDANGELVKRATVMGAIGGTSTQHKLVPDANGKLINRLALYNQQRANDELIVGEAYVSCNTCGHVTLTNLTDNFPRVAVDHPAKRDVVRFRTMHTCSNDEPVSIASTFAINLSMPKPGENHILKCCTIYHPRDLNLLAKLAGSDPSAKEEL